MKASQDTAVWWGSQPDRVAPVLLESFPELQSLDADARNIFFDDVRKAISTSDSTGIARKLAVVAISIFASAIVSAGSSWAQSNLTAVAVGLVVIICILVGQMLVANSPLKLQRAVAQAIADTLDRHGLEHDEMSCLAAAERILNYSDSYWPVINWLLCSLLLSAAFYASGDMLVSDVKNNLEYLGTGLVAMFLLSTITAGALYCFATVSWLLGKREVSCNAGRQMAMLVIITIRASTVAFPLFLLLDMAMSGTHPQ